MDNFIKGLEVKFHNNDWVMEDLIPNGKIVKITRGNETNYAPLSRLTMSPSFKNYYIKALQT